MLFLYRSLINLTLLISPLIVIFRLIKKKEHPIRFIEKFAFSSKKRGPGKLIWFHGSSVGELLSIMPLVEKLEKEEDSERFNNLALVIFDQAKLAEGTQLEEPANYVARLNELLLELVG